ncbi:hypothetical protein L3X38_025920 [Prunus dulcis]|uniref:Uncharacterized protein n=1 Tax=Prunus dulcis TaxID=3755 RepID=A0AAD4W3E2_PRUDU|nr:hypothetical protein L3X38_025920 [Prunus dulcis]
MLDFGLYAWMLGIGMYAWLWLVCFVLLGIGLYAWMLGIGMYAWMHGIGMYSSYCLALSCIEFTAPAPEHLNLVDKTSAKSPEPSIAANPAVSGIFRQRSALSLSYFTNNNIQWHRPGKREYTAKNLNLWDATV